MKSESRSARGKRSWTGVFSSAGITVSLKSREEKEEPQTHLQNPRNPPKAAALRTKERKKKKGNASVHGNARCCCCSSSSVK